MQFPTSHLSLPMRLILFAALALPVTLAAQQRPPIRPLGATTARAAAPLPSAMAVRALPGGRVLVNDVAGRKLVLLDSTLATATVVADTTSATGNAYGGRIAGLIPWRGDSSLFVDPQSLSMLVIDPAGKVGRVMSVPRSEDAISLAGLGGGQPALDAKGRLVYRLQPRPRMERAAGVIPGPPAPPDIPDSAALVRVDLATRTFDTVTFVKTPKVKMDVSQDARGSVRMTSQVNPLPVVDDWAVLADGSMAVVRGRDYHVDLFGADGARTSAAKIPFEWQRLTDEDKVAFIDSVKAARARQLASAPAPAAGGASSSGTASAPAPAAGSGGPVMMTMTISGDGGGPRTSMGGGAPGGPAQLNFVAPSELPDYKPAFFSGSARADAAGNLWIRTIPTRAIPGGPVYDVVNAQGVLVDRVQVPEGRTIVGFGADGAVWLAARDAGGVWMERARVR